MGGYAQLTVNDAHKLAAIMADLTPVRADMLLTCYASLFYGAKDAPPYFSLGVRELARLCGHDKTTVQRFLNDMRRAGVIVDVGNAGRGRRPKRSFAWHINANWVYVFPQQNAYTENAGKKENADTPSRKGGKTHTPQYSFLRGNADTSESKIHNGRLAQPVNTGAHAQQKPRMPWED